MTILEAGPRSDVERLRSVAQALEREVARAIVGQQLVIRGVTIALLAGGHVLLEGLPGLGKTLLVHTIARALQLQYSRVQFTPDLMPADEINRATPRTQSALLEA